MLLALPTTQQLSQNINSGNIINLEPAQEAPATNNKI
jgi:hypothetical protein